MQTHVKVLAVLFLVFGAFFVLLALFAPFLTSFLAGIVGSSGEDSAATGAAVLGLVGMMATVFLLICAVPSIACGLGLLSRKPWARILGIILAALGLIKIPFGTIFGIYALWVFFNKETEALFAAPTAPSTGS